MRKLILAAMLSTLAIGAYAAPNAGIVQESIFDKDTYQRTFTLQYSPNPSCRLPWFENRERDLRSSTESIEEIKGKVAALQTEIVENTMLCEKAIKKNAMEEAESNAARKRFNALPNPRIGMSAKTVREKTKFGPPNDINRTVGKWGVHEQWVYGNGVYLYFENGILTSFQD